MLQRKAGNAAVNALLQRRSGPAPAPSGGGGTIRRLLGSGYYLVCGPTEEGATAVGDGRFYRTVDKLPDGAVKSARQPFSVWSLYEKPTVVAPPVEQEGAEDEADDVGASDAPTTTGATTTGTATPKRSKAEKNKARKQRLKAAKATATATTDEDQQHEEEADDGPEEPAWVTRYRATTTLTGQGLEDNIAYLRDRELGGRTTQLEAQLTALGTAWVPEMEAGVEGVTLADRQAALRAAMPTWDGDQKTVVKALGAMTSHIAKVEAAAEVAKKVAKVKGVIGAEALTELLSTFAPEAAVTYADTMGHERLKVLLQDKKLKADVLQHYGAAMMKTFVGAGAEAWTHLTTAKLNGDGAISGAHDEDVFNDYIADNGFEVVGTPTPAATYKVRYRKVGTTKVLGSKTLIQGLADNKETWLTTFNTAIWKGIADKKLVVGQYTVGDPGSQYSGFYKSGKAEVDTVFPV